MPGGHRDGRHDRCGRVSDSGLDSAQIDAERPRFDVNAGCAPVSATEFPEAANVNDGTITSSPRPIPAASIPRWSAELLFTAIRDDHRRWLRTPPRILRPRVPGQSCRSQKHVVRPLVRSPDEKFSTGITVAPPFFPRRRSYPANHRMDRCLAPVAQVDSARAPPSLLDLRAIV